MKSYRDLREKRYGMIAREFGVLVGCGHTDVTRIERRENHNAFTEVAYIFLAQDAKKGMKVLVRQAPFRKRTFSQEDFQILKRIARRAISVREHTDWVKLMYKHHPYLAQDTTTKT